jgi:enoyl-CoA hydratase
MTALADTDVLIESTPEDGVALIRLNRPKVFNALNLELRCELASVFSRLDSDSAIRAIVLAGNDRAFCAGADLTEYANATPIDIISRDMDRLWGAIAACRKPVIAAINGHALGGGCELAMHADIIIAGRGASFAQPEVRLGIMPGGGATQRLTRAVGKFQAMKLLLTGDTFTVAEAHAMGLISEIVDDAEVEARALCVAREISFLPVLAVRMIKEAVLASQSTDLQTGLNMERKSFQLLFATADKTEGIRARLEKRAPRFSA